MTDLPCLFAKIRALPQRRMAQVDDFVDFLLLRRTRRPKPRLTLWQRMEAIEEASERRRQADPPEADDAPAAAS